jgi:DNA-3-methyladenine glycosylase II
MQAKEPELDDRAKTPDAAVFPPSAVPTTPKKASKKINGDSGKEIPLPPPAFTPSIDRTLRRTLPQTYDVPPLPEGMNVKELQSRLDGKKKIKCVL